MAGSALLSTYKNLDLLEGLPACLVQLFFKMRMVKMHKAASFYHNASDRTVSGRFLAGQSLAAENARHLRISTTSTVTGSLLDASQDAVCSSATKRFHAHTNTASKSHTC